MISVIIPIYNQANKLSQCLDSLLGQTFTDYEVIIINDGSQDELLPVVNSYRAKFTGHNFKFITQENQGSNPARNRGAQEASGEFLLFCDADLIMQPSMLHRMHQALQDNPQASYAYSSFYYGRKLFKLWPWQAKRLRHMPYIHTSSLIRASDFPGFDNAVKRLQDWDLWLTMLEQKHQGVFIKEPLFTIQVGGMISRWLPKAFYRLLPWLPAVRQYHRAEIVIKTKHNLS